MNTAQFMPCNMQKHADKQKQPLRITNTGIKCRGLKFPLVDAYCIQISKRRSNRVPLTAWNKLRLVYTTLDWVISLALFLTNVSTHFTFYHGHSFTVPSISAARQILEIGQSSPAYNNHGHQATTWRGTAKIISTDSLLLLIDRIAITTTWTDAAAHVYINNF